MDIVTNLWFASGAFRIYVSIIVFIMKISTQRKKKERNTPITVVFIEAIVKTVL